MAALWTPRLTGEEGDLQKDERRREILQTDKRVDFFSMADEEPSGRAQHWPPRFCLMCPLFFTWHTKAAHCLRRAETETKKRRNPLNSTANKKDGIDDGQEKKKKTQPRNKNVGESRGRAARGLARSLIKAIIPSSTRERESAGEANQTHNPKVFFPSVRRRRHHQHLLFLLFIRSAYSIFSFLQGAPFSHRPRLIHWWNLPSLVIRPARNAGARAASFPVRRPQKNTCPGARRPLQLLVDAVWAYSGYNSPVRSNKKRPPNEFGIVFPFLPGYCYCCHSCRQSRRLDPVPTAGQGPIVGHKGAENRRPVDGQHLDRFVDWSKSKVSAAVVVDVRGLSSPMQKTPPSSMPQTTTTKIAVLDDKRGWVTAAVVGHDPLPLSVDRWFSNGKRSKSDRGQRWRHRPLWTRRVAVRAFVLHLLHPLRRRFLCFWSCPLQHHLRPPSSTRDPKRERAMIIFRKILQINEEKKKQKQEKERDGSNPLIHAAAAATVAAVITK